MGISFNALFVVDRNCLSVSHQMVPGCRIESCRMVLHCIVHTAFSYPRVVTYRTALYSGGWNRNDFISYGVESYYTECFLVYIRQFSLNGFVSNWIQWKCIELKRAHVITSRIVLYQLHVFTCIQYVFLPVLRSLINFTSNFMVTFPRSNDDKNRTEIFFFFSLVMFAFPCIFAYSRWRNFISCFH